jgi:hypothetical protein
MKAIARSLAFRLAIAWPLAAVAVAVSVAAAVVLLSPQADTVV